MTFKLKFPEFLVGRLSGKQYPLPPHFDRFEPITELTERVENRPIGMGHEYIVEARIGAATRINYRRNVGTREAKREAARYLVHQLYGDVADEVTDILCLMYDEGLTGTKTARRLRDLLSGLRMEGDWDV